LWQFDVAYTHYQVYRKVHLDPGNLDHVMILQLPRLGKGSPVNPDIRLSKIFASMGDRNRRPRSRRNEKTSLNHAAAFKSDETPAALTGKFCVFI